MKNTIDSYQDTSTARQAELRERALAKLSEEERAVLGLGR